MSGPVRVVGNDFVVVPKPRVTKITPVVAEADDVPFRVPVTTLTLQPHGMTVSPLLALRTPRLPDLSNLGDLFHRYTVAAIALLVLITGSLGLEVAGSYLSARSNLSLSSLPSGGTHASGGLNAVVPADKFDSYMNSVTSQSVIINLGTEPITVSAETIRSWVSIAGTGGTKNLHVDSAKVAAGIMDIANGHLKAPINEVTATHDGAAVVIVKGVDGMRLTDPAGLSAQARTLGKNLLSGHGALLDAPTTTLAFQSVTPAAFAKLLEVNVVTKQMYAYENGTLTRTFPISAGAPETPTPIGQYKIYSKLAVQDMRGYNPNGTKYFQPHVRWINYFLPGGYAVHGNYWRPLSWFGVRNSSHGCVSLPDDQAKWVYDWASVGTTVITHT